MTDANTSNVSSSPNTQQSNDDRSQSNILHNQSTMPTLLNNNNNHSSTTTNHHLIAENGNQSSSTISVEQSHIETKAPIPNPPQRKRRKNIPLSKISRPAVPPSILTNNVKLEKNTPPASTMTNNNTSTSSTKSNATMIFNLIRSLLEEKKSDNNDENLISTIDCLIDSLQHLRERIKILDNNNHEKHSGTIEIIHDETSPLNLSKPKKRQHQRLASANSDDMSPSTTTTVSSPSPSASNLPLQSTIFPSQTLYFDKPFFPPFAGLFILQYFCSDQFSFIATNMTHLQNFLKLSATSLLNDSMVMIEYEHRMILLFRII